MTYLKFLLSLGIGFAIGYVHTGIAIVMLFRPFEEVRFLGLRLQGMIPRRKADMARSVARIFTSDLLREESVAERIGGAEVRKALETLAHEALGRCFGREYGTLRELFGVAGEQAVGRVVESVALEAARALQPWFASPAGEAVVCSGFELLLKRTPAELLPGEEAALSRLVAAKGTALLASPDLEERLREGFRILLPRLAESRRALGDLLPPEARSALLQAVRGSVPAILQRFEQVLLSPQNVEKIKGAVRAGIRSYLLEMEGGLLRNLVRRAALLGRERVFREVDAVVDANLYRLGELVYEEENRAHVEQGVWGALEVLLQRAPADLLGDVAPEEVERLAARAAAWAAARLRLPEAGEALARVLERELLRVFHTSLAEIAELSGAGDRAAERLTRVFGRWASHGGLELLARREEGALAGLLLDTPVGRLSRWVAEDFARELVSQALDRVMPAVASKVPEILRIVDVEGLIEREVLRLPPRELERVIVSVAKRELGAIAWWGGVLGALIVATQSALQRFVF
ncbi:MAG: DUF445 family protein [Deltaproteobacteria bacterium]|nr:DUF445 family protein [Deltaproteobacteria bacterium]